MTVKEPAARDPSSRADTVVLSVTVPSNVTTVQILVSNGVPGSNATSLSIDSSSSSIVTLSLAAAPAASDATAGTKPATAADTWTWGEILFWSVVLSIVFLLGAATGADVEMYNALRTSQASAVSAAAASSTGVAVELGRAEGSRGPTRLGSLALQTLVVSSR
jgi:hypothetical protein